MVEKRSGADENAVVFNKENEQELHSAIVPGVPALDHQDNDISKTISSGADKNAVVFNKENEQGLHSEIDPGVPALDHQDNDSSKTISTKDLGRMDIRRNRCVEKSFTREF